MNPILDGWTPPARPISRRQPGADLTRLRLDGEITVEGSVALFAAIRTAHANTIEIEIDSSGGNALCSLALYELLIMHPHHVGATITGRASSGAAIVAMGADQRRIVASGSVMVHRTTGPDEWRQHVDELAAGIFAEATGNPLHLTDAWRAGQMTFTAEQALAAGFAHAIL